MNTGASWPSLIEANARVLEIQTKLHRWASENEDRRFDDLFNLVCDPAFLRVAWERVRSNKGSRTAGIDGESARQIESQRGGVVAFANDLRADLKARTFRPQPVREVMIPKPGTRKRRRLGIPTVRDRVVQAALKLVLEPIFEKVELLNPTTVRTVRYRYRGSDIRSPWPAARQDAASTAESCGEPDARRRARPVR